MIKAFIEQAIKNIEEEKRQKVAVAKDRIVREKIAPHNAEVDSLRAKALAQLDNELNVKIAELRKEYDGKKQQLVAVGEKDKASYAEEIYAAELAVLTVDYDSAISKLTAQLADIKE